MSVVLTIIETGIRNSKKLKKQSKQGITFAWCHIMSHSYNKKYQTWNIVNILKKTLFKMDYHVRCFLSLRPNDQYYDKNRDIVCDNVPILCTHVHLGMTNNVVGGSFPFRRTEKLFSNFWVPKTRCFVKQPPNKILKMVPPHFSKIWGPTYIGQFPNRGILNLSVHS